MKKTRTGANSRHLAIHGGLRAAALALWLCLPWIAIEIWILCRHWPVRPLELWIGALALIMLPLSAWICQLRKWAYRFAWVFFSTWAFATAWLAIVLKNPNLGFWAVGTLVLFGAVLGWVRTELGRSFLDPKVQWFERLPKPIPGLACEIHESGLGFRYHVGRLDRDGLFLLSFCPSPGKPKAAEKVTLSLQFGNSVIELGGIVRKVLRRAEGVGVQFTLAGPDARKELGDFIERLREAGYV